MRRIVQFVVVLGLTATVLVPSGPPAQAQADPNAYDAYQTYITSADGTRLHTRYYRPAGATDADRTPVLLTVSPYEGSGGAFFFGLTNPTTVVTGAGGPPGLARSGQAFARGYSVVVVSLRGYGGSEGCFDLGGPGEQADAKAAVEWSASQPWSTGKVGMFGHSYPAQTQIMALATEPDGLSAVVASAPPTGIKNFYTNGVRNFGNGTGFGAFYAGSDLWPPALTAPAEEWTNAIRGSAEGCYPGVVAGSLMNTTPDDAYWAERDIDAAARGSRVPTLYVHGFDDFNVRTTNSFPLFTTLRGPHRGIFGPWDHGIPRNGDVFTEEMMAWYDHHLKGLPLAPQWPVRIQEPDGRWRPELEWPPPDAVLRPLSLNDGTWLDLPGNNAETGLPDQFPIEPPLPLPTGSGSWTFTQPLPHEYNFAGHARLTATVDSLVPNVNLVVLVYDVAPSGEAHFITRGASLVEADGTHTFDLYPQDWRLAAGHRLGILLTSADDAWFESSATATPVSVTEATLEVPILRYERPYTLPTGPFRPRSQHPPFTIDQDTIDGATKESAMPPEPKDLP